MEREDRVGGGSQTQRLTTDRQACCGAGLNPGNRNSQVFVKLNVVAQGKEKTG